MSTTQSRDVFDKASRAADCLREEAARWKDLYERERDLRMELIEKTKFIREEIRTEALEFRFFGARYHTLSRWVRKMEDLVWSQLTA